MGDINQLNFVKNNIKLAPGSILEVGSKDFGNTPDFRSIFPDREYVGLDMQEGKGVDVVLDLSSDFDCVNEKLGGKRFKTIICFSVLEHCRNPFKMCANIEKLLDKNGLLFISVPFAWRIHGYPSDYWRFTPDGIKTLFPQLNFEAHAGSISTSKIDQIGPIDDYMFRAELDILKGLKLKRYGYFRAAFILMCRKIKILPFVFDFPYLLAPVMINMIGDCCRTPPRNHRKKIAFLI